MEGFLAENNNCGQVLLHLVSRGNAIIAELLRLKDFIPPFFRPIGADEVAKWENVIYDFAYFKNPVAFDQATRNNPTTQALFEEIEDNHLDLINRFYVAFESIHKFATDVNNYVDDLEEGAYIQQNLDSVFKNEDGSQLLCEAVYLYGVMLLVLDLHIPGNIREKILVSYYRYSGKKTILGSNVDDVCKMLRSTGHGPTGTHAHSHRPPLYPESYFKRVPLQQKLVDLVIDGLRSEDMYHQITAFPSLEHRTAALASQAAMLFVCLFFKPDWLNSQTAKMRNIVDKYFPDNWVISIYMGISVNLIDAWDTYKAAKAALANTVEAANVKQLIETHARVISTSLTEYKSEEAIQGPIPREKWSSYLTKKMNLLTKFNVTIRWSMLHSNVNHHLFTPGRQAINLRNQIRANQNFNDEQQLELLLTTAELELKVKNMYKTLLECREQYWDKSKKEAFERTLELKDLLSKSNPVGRGKKDEQLSKWFGTMAGIIDTLDLNNLQDSTKKIVGIISALDGAKGHIETLGSKQLKWAEAELRQCLVVMVQGESVREQDLISLQIVADISYGWLLVDELSDRVRSRIEREPEHVARLRALFLKLASAMEIPLLRINQAGSQDLMSVSQHYSDELVAYVRKVLRVIPQKMFVLMLEIMQVKKEVKHTSVPVNMILLDFPKKVEWDVQLKLAKLTQRVAKFADGILQMKSTLVGVIEIDPKKMLEDGIRNELVIQISTYLESILQFNKKAKHDEIRYKLEDLSKNINRLMNSLEYIQDFLSICGLKIFQEEMNRVIGFNVDMESNVYLKEKVLPWQSTYQNRAIPVQLGLHGPKDSHATFVGRLLAQLIAITDYKTTTYYPSAMSWFENKIRLGQVQDGQATADLQLFDCMSHAISVSGLAGLDRLICYNIVSELQNLLKLLQENCKEKNWLEFLGKISQELSPNGDNIVNPASYYGSVVSRPHLAKLFALMRQSVCRVGQLQLIRKHIFVELKTGCKFHSKGYFKALQNLDRALLGDVKDHFDDPKNKPYQDSQFLSEVSILVDWAGIGNPYSKIYVADQCPEFLALITFLYTLREIGLMKYEQRFGIFTCVKSVDSFDGHPLMLGVHTLLHQFHPEIWDQFSVYMAQCIRSHAAACDVNKSQFYPVEVYHPIYLMRKLVETAGLPRTALSDKIPKVILDLYPNHIPMTASFAEVF